MSAINSFIPSPSNAEKKVLKFERNSLLFGIGFIEEMKTNWGNKKVCQT